MSLQNRLEASYIKEAWEELLTSMRAEQIVVYIPGHCGITHIEISERLVGEAQQFGELQ